MEAVTGWLRCIAPLELAEDWDNVGMLVWPTRPRPVRKIFLTIDLTDAVLEEALATRADLVVAYHPPIFHPLRRLSAEDPASRVVLRLIESGTALYSPHTAADAAPGGVNDWLADGLGDGRRQAIARPRGPWPPGSVLSGAGGGSSDGGSFAPADRGERATAPIAGQGRQVALEEPATLDELIRRVKRHLDLKHLRVASATDHACGGLVKNVALCAGAGSDVILDADADLLLTGEMRHHDVRSANARGKSVILCDHTNTERGYLARLRERLVDLSTRGPGGGGHGRPEVAISSQDRDPLEVR